MGLRQLSALLLLAGSLALAGCEASGVIKPRGTMAVNLESAKKRGTITVGLAELLAFTLPAARPGYVWQISFHDTRYLKQYTDFLPPKAEGGGMTVSFLAILNGQTRLRFVLVPMQSDLPVNPVDQQDIVVQIK